MFQPKVAQRPNHASLFQLTDHEWMSTKSTPSIAKQQLPAQPPQTRPTSPICRERTDGPVAAFFEAKRGLTLKRDEKLTTALSVALTGR